MGRQSSVRASSEALAERLSLWWWVRLPLRVARLIPILGSGLSDGLYLVRWPWVAAAAPLAAFLIGLVLGAFHPDETFSASVLVMALIIAAGVLSAHLGVWAVAGYAAGDFFLHSHLTFGVGLFDSLLRVRIPLVLSYFLLALPAVIVPLLLAAVRLQVRQLKLPLRLRIGLEIVTYLALGAILVYLWALAAAVLIRPVFTWRGGQPTTAAIFPLQERGWLLSAAVVVTAIVRMVLEERAWGPRLAGLATLMSQALQLTYRQHRGMTLNRQVGLVAGAAALTLLMAGMIGGWLEGLLVFLFLALVLWLRNRLQRAGWPWLGIIARIPIMVRFILGLMLGYLMSRVVVSALWSGTNSFRPVLIATVLSVAILTLFTAVVQPPQPRAEAQGAPEPSG